MQVAAKVNLNSASLNCRTRTNLCGTCGGRARQEMAKTTVEREATVECTFPLRRGDRGDMHKQTDRLNWGPTRTPDVRRTKKISRRMDASGSDEAIVSDDLAGQHNRSVSQGPLGESVWEGDPEHRKMLVRKDHRALTTILASRISQGIPLAKVAMDFSFEAVLGKTRRTEF